MKVNKPPLDPNIKIEREIISLMLRFENVVSEMINYDVNAEMFDEDHRLIVKAIFEVYMNSPSRDLLSTKNYRDWLQRNDKLNEITKCLNLHHICSGMRSSVQDDFYSLRKRFLDNYVQKKGAYYANVLKDDIEKKGHFKATQIYVNNLQSVLSASIKGESEFVYLDETKDDFINWIKYQRDNPQSILRCHIPEIDKAVPSGFVPQHLTLFVGDVGSYKTGIMLNIGLNICDQSHANVLFASLEINRRNLERRIISNRTGIDLSHLTNPKFLTKEELKIMEESNVWDAKKHKFAIIDFKEESSVIDIEREIEKRRRFFKPDVLIIDYVAILRPVRRHAGRNDLEIGETLKRLRSMGNKFGFHIISAAQMGRAMIKKMRDDGDKAIPDSTGIRGSHEYSADSDTILALMKPIEQKDGHIEKDKLKVHVVKSRHGPAGYTFELRVDPMHARISSTEGVGLLGECDADFESFEEEMNTDPKIIAAEHVQDNIFNDVSFGIDDLNDIMSD